VLLIRSYLFLIRMDPAPVPDPTLEKSRTRFWIRIRIQTISSTFFSNKKFGAKHCPSNVRSNIVKSNIQFYIVSVRTFVIPFYFGYGSKSAIGTGYGMHTEAGSGPANAKSSGSVWIRIHMTVERKGGLAVLAEPIPTTAYETGMETYNTRKSRHLDNVVLKNYS
jgi:hypothetical protein